MKKSLFLMQEVAMTKKRKILGKSIKYLRERYSFIGILYDLL